MPPPPTINGDPGTSWTNDTSKVMHQAQVNFRNSCGLCIAVAGQIARWWPFPFHFGCTCRNVAIAPGATAEPFVDYIQKLDDLGPSQQQAAVGSANWKLISTGTVKWEDVVTRARIRDFREVVANKKLDARDLVRLGIPRGVVQRATNAISTPAHQQASQTRAAMASALRQHGLSDVEIAKEVGVRLGNRIGIIVGPSGPSGLGTRQQQRRPPGAGGAAVALFLPIRPGPLTPAKARLAVVEQFGEDVANQIDFSAVQSEADLETLIRLLRVTPAEYREYQEQLAKRLGFRTPKDLIHPSQSGGD